MSRPTQMASARLRRSVSRRFSSAVMLALVACLLLPGIDAAAQKKVRDGRLKISTNPGGHQITIDGAPAGETTIFAREFDLPPGPHRVQVLFPNDNRWEHTVNILPGRIECVNLNYRPRPVAIPRAAISPCPYPVNVSASATANDGEIITFSADVAYEGPSALNYTWTISPPTASIRSGAGTPTITVDSTGLGRRNIIAILVIDDGSGDRNCRQTAQASTSIIAPAPLPNPTRRFDEFPSIAYDDDKARFDNFVIELQNSPGARGYVIAYAGRNSRPGTADGLGARARRYLVEARGLDASRLTIVNGGYRDRNGYELWLVPAGAQPPQPTPTSAQPGDYQPPPRRRSRR